jgi:hypothetical protein
VVGATGVVVDVVVVVVDGVVVDVVEVAVAGVVVDGAADRLDDEQAVTRSRTAPRRPVRAVETRTRGQPNQ